MTATTTPSFDLSGKIVLVTGATRGIGRATALACAGAGADMIVGVQAEGRQGSGCRDRGARPPRSGGSRWTSPTSPPVRKAVAKAQKHFGRIDVLVNNVVASARRTCRGRHRGRLRLHGEHQPQGHLLHHQAVAKPTIAAEIRPHHQYQLAGRLVDAARRVDLLHEQAPPSTI